MQSCRSDIRLVFAYPLVMGIQRASTDRRRFNGKICCACHTMLPPPYTYGERYCARCETLRTPKHLIYMFFQLRERWMCQFSEPDLQTVLPRRASFSNPELLLEFASRAGCQVSLEDRQAFDHGVEIGRGGLWLNLTESQYRALKEKS